MRLWLRLRLPVLAALFAASGVLWGGAATSSACAGTVTGKCGSPDAIFSGSDVKHERTVKVTSSGDCALIVRIRKLGESQPEVVELRSGSELSRNGTFAEFTVRCGRGKGSCKATVTGF
jgi:hypothetical protein